MLNLNAKKLPDMSPDVIRGEYISYLSAASSYRFQVAQDSDFHLGNQLTIAQKTFLLGMGQPPESNNKIRPAVEQVLANQAAASPEWKAKMVGKTDYDLAWVISQLMGDIWYESEADPDFRTCSEDFIVKGLTYMYIFPDWNANGGLGALRIMYIPQETMFIDPNSTHKRFKDAASMIYSDMHTKQHLITMLPQYRDKIEAAREDDYMDELGSGNYVRDDIYTRATTAHLDTTQPKVRKFVRFSKVSVPHARIIDPATGFSQVFTDDEYKQFAIDQDYQTLIENDALIEEVVFKTRVRETLIVGNEELYDEIQPISGYSIVPACNGHLRNPFPTGDVRHAKSPQRMLNRTEALIIAYVDAVANIKFGYEENAIEPEELSKFKTPGVAQIKFNPGALRDKKFIEFGSHQAPSELFHQKARYESDIQSIFGAYEFQQGNPAGAPGTVGEAQIIDEAAARKQSWKMLPLYDMLTELGKRAIEWIPHVYDQQRVMNMVNSKGEMEEIVLNRPVVDDRTNAVKIIYDMKNLSADIRVKVGSTRAKSPLAQIQKDLSFLQAGIYDRLQVVMNLEEDIDKKSLLQRIGEIEQLQGQVQQLQEQVKKQSGDLETREREIFHANMRAEIAEATKSVSKAASEIKSSAKLEQARMKDLITNATRDIKDLLEKVQPPAQA